MDLLLRAGGVCCVSAVCWCMSNSALKLGVILAGCFPSLSTALGPSPAPPPPLLLESPGLSFQSPLPSSSSRPAPRRCVTPLTRATLRASPGPLPHAPHTLSRHCPWGAPSAWPDRHLMHVFTPRTNIFCFLRPPLTLRAAFFLPLSSLP